MVKDTSSQIESIQQKLAQMQRLNPQGSVLFGAAVNGYEMKPPASEELLKQFETKHQLSLPEGYREFLLRVGNGGSGPYYGLYELDLTKNNSEIQYGKVEVAPFSSAPLYTAKCTTESDEEASEADDAFYEQMSEKALKICTPGCSYETFLVVDGPRRGQVWTWDSELAASMRVGFWPETLIDVDNQIQASGDSDVQCTFAGTSTNWEEIEICDINPFGDTETPGFWENLPDQGPLFLDWYEHWLNAGLRFFEMKGR